MRLTASRLRKICVRCFNGFLNIGLAVTSRGTNKEIVRRNASRGRGPFRWFTPEEAAVAEALAKVIVPSDDETPGTDEVGVLDEPAIVALDKLVAASSHRQQVYARGLLSFDRWALNERGRRFAELQEGDQIALFKAAQQLWERRNLGVSGIKRAWWKLKALGQVRKGVLFAADLYPQIRSDCLQVFYTSRVSWVWLEYDGPPMEKGYPSVTTPREP